MSTLDQQVALDALRRLSDVRGGSVSNAEVAAIGLTVGRSGRSLRRWQARGLPGRRGPAPWTPTGEHVASYFRFAGKCAAVHRYWKARDPDFPDVSTVRRRFREVLTEGERAAAAQGAKGQAAFTLYLMRQVRQRNALWYMDHKLWPVWLTDRDQEYVFQMWGTTVMDVGTRSVSTVLTHQPTAETVLEAMHKAMTFTEGSHLGGIPERILWDNGLEFLADSVTNACAKLGIDAGPVDAYYPQGKGALERSFQTYTTEFVSTLPFFLHGPRDRAGRLFGMRSRMPMAEELFALRFERYEAHYNAERPHIALGGRTPKQAWIEQDAPLRTLDEALSLWLLSTKRAKMRRDGLFLDKDHAYVGSAISNKVGHDLTIHYRRGDLGRVWVTENGEFLGQVYLRGREPVEETERMLDDRRASRQKVGQWRAAGTRQLNADARPTEEEVQRLLERRRAKAKKARTTSTRAADGRRRPSLPPGAPLNTRFDG